MKGVLLGALVALLIASCVVRRITGPKLTGTCDGACAHYIECKDGHREVDRMRCQTECPQVLGDADSLMAYESLTCTDAVEFVDGRGMSPAGSAAEWRRGSIAGSHPRAATSR